MALKSLYNEHTGMSYMQCLPGTVLDLRKIKKILTWYFFWCNGTYTKIRSSTCHETSNGTEKSNVPGENTWLTRYFHQVPYIMELVTDIRYFINKNQKSFTFFGLDLVNQFLSPGILLGNGTDISMELISVPLLVPFRFFSYFVDWT